MKNFLQTFLQCKKSSVTVTSRGKRVLVAFYSWHCTTSTSPVPTGIISALTSHGLEVRQMVSGYQTCLKNSCRAGNINFKRQCHSESHLIGKKDTKPDHPLRRPVYLHAYRKAVELEEGHSVPWVQTFESAHSTEFEWSGNRV